MAEFADGMKTFTDNLRVSIQARGDSLTGIHTATQDLLDGARSFLGQVAE
jgi:hypothetical protein